MFDIVEIEDTIKESQGNYIKATRKEKENLFVEVIPGDPGEVERFNIVSYQGRKLIIEW